MISFLNPPNDNISISVGNTSRNSNNSSRSNSSVILSQFPILVVILVVIPL